MAAEKQEATFLNEIALHEIIMLPFPSSSLVELEEGVRQSALPWRAESPPQSLAPEAKGFQGEGDVKDLFLMNSLSENCSQPK